ncbi:heterochromatin protein 1-binding protein 3 isoform X2 [Centroberyx affinis]|uniref:heterochromatin protein 1-binding protein 3 isoform X2 n=1 Tax=Centroberyx affinis TaxID=166261 RepID=UPI003A5BC2F3
MPIRRAAATPPQEKAPSTAAEGEPDATSDESPSADEEQAASSATAANQEEGEAAGETEPTQNGEKADGAAADKKGEESEKKGLKDGYKLEKAKVKKVKRTIPAWATVTAGKKIPVSNFAGTQPKVDNILIEAIKSCDDKSGMSYKSVMKYIVKKYPGLELDKRKFLIKKAMKKHLEKGTVKQLKGKGLSGSFAIGKQPTTAKKAVVFPGLKTETLGDALPLIITRLCEPKEASYILIKKYLEQHFPHLDIEHRPEILKSALVKAVEKGQLERITGKGASGTFQLKRTGDKVLLKGGALEDAITTAITAMNEPKTCSTTTLRKYLIDTNKDSKEFRLVANLRKTLTKCKMLGWMEQITGNGLNGTYQLSFPFYPSPAILYPDKVIAPQKKKADVVKRRRTVDSSDEEESAEESEEESDDEPPPPKRRAPKRPPPKARRPLPSKKSRSVSQSKAKAKRPVLAKKSPAKKAAPPAKKAAAQAKKPAEAASKKESAPPAKATPVKRAAPAKKPKTPAVKKLTKSASKRPAPRESSPEPEEPPAKKEVKTKQSTRKSKRGKN